MLQAPILRGMSLLLAMSLFLATAAANVIYHLQQDLSELVEVLRFKGTTHATWAPVEVGASNALQTLLSVADADPEAVPQASWYADSLGRLLAEARYLTDLSEPSTYTHGALDNEGYMTDSVNEWHYTINRIAQNLGKPSRYRPPRTEGSQAKDISEETKPGTEFRDHDAAPKMIVIPTGCYTSGSDPEEHDRWNVTEDRRAFEYPKREVCIRTPLSFSVTEVTVEQFDTFVKESGYDIRRGGRWWDPDHPTAMVFREDLDYLNPGFPQTDDSPAVAMTWQEAIAYTKWLSDLTGERYRLPNEDEWEWAARGGTQDTFFWGDDVWEVDSWANSYEQTSQAANQFRWSAINVTDGFAYTAPVASFRPNGYGLYDVTANAREFMADTWVVDLGAPGVPRNGSVHVGPAPFPVLRGGAWNYNRKNLRINYRSAYFCSEVASNMFGIRLVREL
ncbi:Sulfatase-modifying factor-like protein [Hapsidospora chrysogenum ATCC 11550]|uniref:Sulfatase-modifying factor-like protein n=1 Tax=Hapsidospora chrysogenum (strain ATCC 11550 / CBS 779.69 / DSM 880 / IAM 14645 / JCM 23072 / IMI 49137) TaxID=857340 RepID=A0A086TFQ0_HAPC1|nr:Sulfatase-modifying factor-like protein [Hapsidospora chrysogenum ATCC 11550]